MAVSEQDIVIPGRALDVAVEAATGAGAILRERLATRREITYKGEVDLVTDADHAAEEHVLGVIHNAFPEHRFIGEEGVHQANATVAADSGYTWIVDPLDGTTNYAHRYPHFAVSIALAYQSTVLIGAIYDPMLDELFTGVKGEGAAVNGQSLRVSETDLLIRSMLSTGFSYEAGERAENTALWISFLSVSQALRRDGSAALNMAYVAAGRLDGYWERPINAWDIAAGAVIAEEAGATVTCYGKPFDPFAGEVIASNGRIHNQMEQVILEVVNQ